MWPCWGKQINEVSGFVFGGLTETLRFYKEKKKNEGKQEGPESA